MSTATGRSYGDDVGTAELVAGLFAGVGHEWLSSNCYHLGCVAFTFHVDHAFKVLGNKVLDEIVYLLSKMSSSRKETVT